MVAIEPHFRHSNECLNGNTNPRMASINEPFFRNPNSQYNNNIEWDIFRDEYVFSRLWSVFSNSSENSTLDCISQIIPDHYKNNGNRNYFYINSRFQLYAINSQFLQQMGRKTSKNVRRVSTVVLGFRTYRNFYIICTSYNKIVYIEFTPVIARGLSVEYSDIIYVENFSRFFCELEYPDDRSIIVPYFLRCQSDYFRMSPREEQVELQRYEAYLLNANRFIERPTIIREENVDYGIQNQHVASRAMNQSNNHLRDQQQRQVPYQNRNINPRSSTGSSTRNGVNLRPSPMINYNRFNFQHVGHPRQIRPHLEYAPRHNAQIYHQTHPQVTHQVPRLMHPMHRMTSRVNQDHGIRQISSHQMYSQLIHGHNQMNREQEFRRMQSSHPMDSQVIHGSNQMNHEQEFRRMQSSHQMDSQVIQGSNQMNQEQEFRRMQSSHQMDSQLIQGTNQMNHEQEFRRMQSSHQMDSQVIQGSNQMNQEQEFRRMQSSHPMDSQVIQDSNQMNQEQEFRRMQSSHPMDSQVIQDSNQMNQEQEFRQMQTSHPMDSQVNQEHGPNQVNQILNPLRQMTPEAIQEQFSNSLQAYHRMITQVDQVETNPEFLEPCVIYQIPKTQRKSNREHAPKLLPYSQRLPTNLIPHRTMNKELDPSQSSKQISSQADLELISKRLQSSQAMTSQVSQEQVHKPAQGAIKIQSPESVHQREKNPANAIKNDKNIVPDQESPKNHPQGLLKNNSPVPEQINVSMINNKQQPNLVKIQKPDIINDKETSQQESLPRAEVIQHDKQSSKVSPKPVNASKYNMNYNHQSTSSQVPITYKTIQNTPSHAIELASQMYYKKQLDDQLSHEHQLQLDEIIKQKEILEKNLLEDMNMDVRPLVDRHDKSRIQQIADNKFIGELKLKFDDNKKKRIEENRILEVIQRQEKELATNQINKKAAFLKNEWRFQLELSDNGSIVRNGFTSNLNHNAKPFGMNNDKPHQNQNNLNNSSLPITAPSQLNSETVERSCSPPLQEQLVGTHPSYNPLYDPPPSSAAFKLLKQEYSEFGEYEFKSEKMFKNMTKEELMNECRKHDLCVTGSFSVLKNRVRLHHRKVRRSTESKSGFECPYEYIIVVDFEATCQSTKGHAYYPHEIIEFPAVAIHVPTLTVVNTFSRFVKPCKNPKLSFFCKFLTGMKQENVDQADTFIEVLDEFLKWMSENAYTNDNSCLLTDGSNDVAKFLQSQCYISGIKIPPFAYKWINIRKIFINLYRCQQQPLYQLINFAGVEFEGNAHSGIDDSHNIARLTMMMLRDGVEISANEKLRHPSSKSFKGDALIDSINDGRKKKLVARANRSIPIIDPRSLNVMINESVPEREAEREPEIATETGSGSGSSVGEGGGDNVDYASGYIEDEASGSGLSKELTEDPSESNIEDLMSYLLIQKN